MNIIVTLSLSISILTVAIVQYKITKTNRERFEKINEEIKKIKGSIKEMRVQVEDYHECDVDGYLIPDSRTLRGDADEALYASKRVNEKIGYLEDYLGVKLVETPEKPAVIKYKPVKKKSDKEWTDYEEPKEHWAIDQFGEPINVSGLSRLQLEKLHRIGNDFPSENATTKAIEKLKALKRLKDKGFRTTGYDRTAFNGKDCLEIITNISVEEYSENEKDLALLFRDDKSSKEQAFHRADIEFGGEE